MNCHDSLLFVELCQLIDRYMTQEEIIYVYELLQEDMRKTQQIQARKMEDPEQQLQRWVIQGQVGIDNNLTNFDVRTTWQSIRSQLPDVKSRVNQQQKSSLLKSNLTTFKRKAQAIKNKLFRHSHSPGSESNDEEFRVNIAAPKSAPPIYEDCISDLEDKYVQVMRRRYSEEHQPSRHKPSTHWKRIFFFFLHKIIFVVFKTGFSEKFWKIVNNNIEQANSIKHLYLFTSWIFYTCVKENQW